jgi:hypothetical protein
VFVDENAIRFFDPDHSAEEDRFIMLGLRVSLKPSDNKRTYGFSFPHPVADLDIVEAAESSKDGLCSG